MVRSYFSSYDLLPALLSMDAVTACRYGQSSGSINFDLNVEATINSLRRLVIQSAKHLTQKFLGDGPKSDSCMLFHIGAPSLLQS